MRNWRLWDVLKALTANSTYDLSLCPAVVCISLGQFLRLRLVGFLNTIGFFCQGSQSIFIFILIFLLSFEFVAVNFNRWLLRAFEQALVRCVILSVTTLEGRVMWVGLHGLAHTAPVGANNWDWTAYNTLLDPASRDYLPRVLLMISCVQLCGRVMLLVETIVDYCRRAIWLVPIDLLTLLFALLLWVLRPRSGHWSIFNEGGQADIGWVIRDEGSNLAFWAADSISEQIFVAVSLGGGRINLCHLLAVII